jgi:hypothetical protein
MPADFDPLVASSTLWRWGNFDYATNIPHWDPAEIPSGEAVPTTKTLPASLYLSGKPAWFGNAAWPPIGPDVAGMASPLLRPDSGGVCACRSTSIPDSPGVPNARGRPVG